jgi:hypothetical protein
MAKLNTKLPASTLLEVIIAMVVILIVFTLAIGIYNNVLRSTTSVKKIQVSAEATYQVKKSIIDSNWIDQDIERDSLVLKKTVIPYQNYKDLVIVTVVALEHGKQIEKSRRIVKKTSHEDQ